MNNISFKSKSYQTDDLRQQPTMKVKVDVNLEEEEDGHELLQANERNTQKILPSKSPPTL